MALSDKDVDSEMAADWAEIQGRYRAEEPEAPPEPVSDVSAEPDASAEPKTAPKSRDADGKFKAAPADDKAPAKDAQTRQAKPARVDAPAERAAPDHAADGQPQRDVNRPPSSWKPAAREKFGALDPAIKAEIHRREQDFQTGQAQLLPDATLGKNIRQVIEPYRMLIEAEGGTPERAVADLFRTAAIFRTGSMQQKYQAVAQIAQQFGLDLRVFSPRPNGAPNPNPQPAPNPQFRDPRVDQLLHQQQQERAQAAQREQQITESTVERWMNEADAEGNPKRPYLNDVINEMAVLVPQLMQADPSLTHSAALDAAYDRAIWAHPETRTLLAQKQQTELDAKRRTDNQARVRDARRAGSVNVPRRGSQPAPGKPGTMEDTIRETARELGFFT